MSIDRVINLQPSQSIFAVELRELVTPPRLNAASQNDRGDRHHEHQMSDLHP